MADVKTPEERYDERLKATVDLLYLMNLTWLYVFSLLYPLVGIIFGIILRAGSISERGKRIGMIALILGIINLVVIIVVWIIVFVIAFAAAAGGRGIY